MTSQSTQSDVFNRYFEKYACPNFNKMFSVTLGDVCKETLLIEPLTEMMDYRFQKLGNNNDKNVNWMIIQCYYLAFENIREGDLGLSLDTFLDSIDKLKDSYLEDIQDLSDRVESAKSKKQELRTKIYQSLDSQFSYLEDPRSFSTVSMVAKFTPFDQVITDDLQELRSIVKSIVEMNNLKKTREAQMIRLTNWMVSNEFEEFEDCYGDIVDHLGNGARPVLPRRLAYHG